MTYCHNMRTHNSNDVFYITLSKWKVWTYTLFCWTIACVPLFIVIIILVEWFKDKQTSTSDLLLFLAIFGTIFLLIAAIPFIFLTKLNKPIATLTQNGFSGLNNLKKQSYAWTPNTIVYRGNKGNVILANLDATQSFSSKLWSGPKAAVIVHNFFAKQKRQDVLKALHRLSPYPVEETTLWALTKRS